MAVTAPQQCGAATAFTPSPSRLNGVGYNTALNVEDPWQFIGASFECIGEAGMITLDELTSPEGIEDGDQIQMSFTDDFGRTQMKGYEYWGGDGWADPDSGEIIGDSVGFTLGQGAWFISASPKSITTAGGVKKENHIHPITEPWSINASAFPTDFCPNSENVSWGCNDGDQIQVPFTDEKGRTQMKGYEYWAGDGWADPDSGEILEADFAVQTAGKGFWFITGEPEGVTFTEVSPLAD